MAAFLIQEALLLALGLAIGWWIKSRFAKPRIIQTDLQRLAAEFRDHCEKHAEAQRGSVVITAPEAYVPLSNGDHIPVSLR